MQTIYHDSIFPSSKPKNGLLLQQLEAESHPEAKVHKGGHVLLHHLGTPLRYLGQTNQSRVPLLPVLQWQWEVWQP
jgi:hypothetical protein